LSSSSSPSPSCAGEFRSFDPKDIGSRGTYSLGISAIVPRPIAVITTQSETGIVNCAPFS
jgi:flavin reductase (DIM6/NTAB) family NADH-FMN oxidoreductase RutF